MYDSIDFRVSDDNPRKVECGLFVGEDCGDVIELSVREATELYSVLGRCIAQVRENTKP